MAKHRRVYYIDGFNPASEFHSSLHLDYPNRSDQMLNPGTNLGGNILLIHGGCRTEGCLAVTDDAIKELYWLAVEARTAGQQRIPVHIFPARLNDDELYRLTQVFTEDPYLKRFWANLKPAYDFFETKRQLPPVRVDDRGRYLHYTVTRDCCRQHAAGQAEIGHQLGTGSTETGRGGDPESLVARIQPSSQRNFSFFNYGISKSVCGWQVGPV